MPPDSARLLSNTFCLLLAGGKGTRLHELTRAECKPALPFAGGRLVDFTLANAHRSGVRQMMVATQYTPQTLWRHLDHTWRGRFPGGLEIRDGEMVCSGGYRGTADVVRGNLDPINDSGASEILVLSADHVYEMDYAPMVARHHATGALVTLAVAEVPVDQATAFGVLAADADGRITDFVEKPRYPRSSPDHPGKALVSMGIYVIDRRWLAGLLATRPGLTDFGHDILPAAVSMGQAQIHHPLPDAGRGGYWRDVGTLDSYRRSQLDCLDPATAPLRLPAAPNAPALPALVAAACGTVLMPGARLGRGARVKRSIVGPHTFVPEGMVIGEDAETDRRWFRVTPDGTILVTGEMLARRADDVAFPVPVPTRPPLTVRGA